MADYPERLSAESTKAYQAACAYFSLGAARSCEAVAEECRKSVGLMYRWSAQHAWVDRARDYDRALAHVAAEQDQARYLAELEAHRKHASDAGEGVYIVAAKLLQQLNKELDTLELTPATLGVLLRAFTVSLDLEAHSLGIDRIMELQRDAME